MTVCTKSIHSGHASVKLMTFKISVPSITLDGDQETFSSIYQTKI